MRTFVLSLIIVCLLGGIAAADTPTQKAKTDAKALQVLYHPGKDKVMILHPVFRPGVDKIAIRDLVYHPGVDKVKISDLSNKPAAVSPAFSKQTPITSTSNIYDKILNSGSSAKAKVPVLKNERGSSGCAKKGDRSSP
jgi:hypothetical protein